MPKRSDTNYDSKHDRAVEQCTGRVRWVRSEKGELVLQQLFSVDEYNGTTLLEHRDEWRDVPIEKPEG